MVNQSSAAPLTLHEHSEPFEQAGAFLRSRGLAAPSVKAKFATWLAENAAARATLLSEFPVAAIAVGLEVEVPALLADLKANPPEAPSVALGRKILDANLTEAQLKALLVDRPAVLNVLTASIEAWRQSIAGPEAQAAVQKRMAAVAAANQAEQARARTAGPPVVRARVEAKAAEERQLLKKVQALQASGRWNPPAA